MLSSPLGRTMGSVVPMASETLSLIQAGPPTSFAERGAAVPFTTPALLGARVRLAARGVGELVVPNPSGWRGDYVLGWDGLDALCRATVHDRQLIVRLRALPRPDPYTVREAAWRVAAEGFAGPSARLAATHALAADRAALARTAAELLTMLVGVPSATLATLRQAELARRDRDASAGNGLVTTIGDVAAALAPIGFGAHAASARLPRLLAQIVAARDSLLPVVAAGGENAELADTFVIAATMVIDSAQTLMDSVRASVRDLAGVLHR
jgi:hypothetical protein